MLIDGVCVCVQVGREARGVRQCEGGDGGGEANGGIRVSLWENLQEDHHHRLWRAQITHTHTHRSHHSEHLSNTHNMTRSQVQCMFPTEHISIENMSQNHGPRSSTIHNTPSFTAPPFCPLHLFSW